MLKVLGLPLCLSVSAASARVRRFGKRLLATLGHEAKNPKKKTNNEIVNVYLLFCLYISYCFKPLSSVILHQKSSSHFTSYSTQFIGQFFFVLVGKIYKKTLINITLLSY
ncbi:hypothetical protein EDC96DRAFT_527439 [Choanephora cucurbitarum]|nr:hypothetical protein EDC96DRAFT_527439 [Choanephora cucurbitarum]